MMRGVIVFLFYLIAFNVSAQGWEDQIEKFSSKSNPYYWKNRKPHPDYWQQDAHYKIVASIDENTDILSGSEDIVYVNNSPDTLSKVYFYLPSNAYQPDSYLDKLNKANQNPTHWGPKYQQKKLGIEIAQVYQDSQPLIYNTDNTIMEVKLNKPLIPGASLRMKITFKSYFDITSGWVRMRVYNSSGFKHYNGALWYPKLCVYDRRFGWSKDQHFGHEFYGDFGTYDVSLTFANNFIIEATGILQNQDVVLPADLRKKLDISNFAQKPIGEAPSVIIPYDSLKRKTWHYIADNVHSFAFVADPTFRLSETEWNGIKCIAIATESNAGGWQDAADITKKCIQIYSKDFGPYLYPKMVVADAQSGMEYPMLTLNSGVSPVYKNVFAHEIGHNWFYGMVGNNETYSSFMDEGFTTMLNIHALSQLGKFHDPTMPKYIQKHTDSIPLREELTYLPYLENAIKTDGVQLNTHSDYFLTDKAYGNVFRQTYYKGAVLLYNLQYVLGDSLFQSAMKNYIREWSFCHPYVEDFRESIIRYTKVDLNWFFDQWLNTNRVVDYKVSHVKHLKNDEYEIAFFRKESGQMPLDFTVVDENDSCIRFHIPNTDFVKKTDATILTRWTGWNNLNREYKVLIHSDGGVKNVIIDTTCRLGDVYMPDNSWKDHVDYSFDYGLNEKPNWRKYQMKARPDFWWNNIDGVKMGFHLSGDYFKYLHQFEASFWMNVGIIKGIGVDPIQPHQLFSFVFDYSHPIRKITKNTFVLLGGRELDGLSKYYIGVQHRMTKSELTFKFQSMCRSSNRWSNYLIYPEEWTINPNGQIALNNTLNIEYKLHGAHNQFQVNGISSIFSNYFQYSKVRAQLISDYSLDLLKLKTRLFGQIGMGKVWPIESMLYLSGGSPEQMMDDKYLRSTGFFGRGGEQYGAGIGHLQYGGDLNLRGYSGYLASVETRNGQVVNTYRGTSGFALNAELEFDEYLNFKPKALSSFLKCNTYLFCDAGLINQSQVDEDLAFANVRADAGVGMAITIKKWGNIQKAKPLTIRFDFPLWLNRIPAIEQDYFAYRWVVGVRRAF